MNYSSTVIQRAHLAVTALLLLVILAMGGLVAAGRLHFSSPTKVTSDDDTSKSTESPKDKEKSEGRYQVELVDDMRALVGNAGNLGFFGESTDEVWVYKYKGGFIECSIEAETFGQVSKGQTIPEAWPRLLSGDESLQLKKDAPVRKEGFILVAAMRPYLPVNVALASHHVHLGGLFGVGPAGVLHQLTTLHVDSSHWRHYRIMLTAGPPNGEQGAGFNLWAEQQLNIRLPIIPRDPAQEDFHAGGGKDLIPDQDIVLLERVRGLSKVRLKAKFLSDPRVTELLATKPK